MGADGTDGSGVAVGDSGDEVAGTWEGLSFQQRVAVEMFASKRKLPAGVWAGSQDR